MLDIRPATDMLAAVVAALPERALGGPTPCERSSVAGLLDHVDGLSVAFVAAARKQPLSGSPRAHASQLAEGWQQRIPARLVELADAWSAPEAWTGMTAAGGLDMPGDVAGLVALDEVVVHGWDIAAATGQPYSCDSQLLEAVHGFVRTMVVQYPHGSPGLFGPPVDVADDAPLLDRVLALTGRDPAWTPASNGG